MIDNTFHAALIALFMLLLGATGVSPDTPAVPDDHVAEHREIVKVFDAPREI
jgi:hypothetical protein